jgi:hypothetical protein
MLSQAGRSIASAVEEMPPRCAPPHPGCIVRLPSSAGQQKASLSDEHGVHQCRAPAHVRMPAGDIHLRGKQRHAVQGCVQAAGTARSDLVGVNVKTLPQVRSPHMFASACSHSCAALIPHAPVPLSSAVVSTSAGATAWAACGGPHACGCSGSEKAACTSRARRGALLRGRWPHWPQPRRRRTLPCVHDGCWRRRLRRRAAGGATGGAGSGSGACGSIRGAGRARARAPTARRSATQSPTPAAACRHRSGAGATARASLGPVMDGGESAGRVGQQ